MELGANASWRDYLEAFLPHSATLDTRANLANYLGLPGEGDVIQKLDWLGLFDRNDPIGVQGSFTGRHAATPAGAESGSWGPTTRTWW